MQHATCQKHNNARKQAKPADKTFKQTKQNNKKLLVHTTRRSNNVCGIGSLFNVISV